MRKEYQVFDYFCDICGSRIGSYGANSKCVICGKDVCIKCARYVCSKESPPQMPTGFTVYGFGTCLHKEEFVICKNCTDALKLSLEIAARKKDASDELAKE